MKTASPDLQSLIYATGSWYAADLVSIYLTDQTLRFTTYDSDLTLSGTNLFKYSEQFDQATWVKNNFGTGVPVQVTGNAGLAPDSTLTADRIVLNKGAGTTLGDSTSVYQATDITALGTYTFSCWLRTESGTANITMYGPGGYFIPSASLSTAWKRFTATGQVTSTGTLNTALILRGTYGTDNSASFLAWGAQLVPGPIAGDYVRTTTTASSSPTTWRSGNDISRTNLITYSEDLTNWTQSSVTVSGGLTSPSVSPAQLVIPSVSNVQHRIGRSVTLTAGVTATISAYLKKGGETQAALYIDNPYTGAGFDLSSGTFTNYYSGGTPSSASIVPVGNGWYRCSLAVVPSGSSNVWLYISRNGVQSYPFAGDGVSGVQAWGFQVVTGTVLSDYVPTTTTSATVATAPALTPSDFRSALGFEVTTLDLILHGANVYLSGGMGLHQAAALGRLDGARVTMERCYMANPGDTSTGRMTLFDGQVSTAEPAATELRMRLRSRAELFKTKFPRRMFQPSCPYVLGDPSCQVTTASFALTGKSVSSGSASTTTVVRVDNYSGGADTYRGGILVINAGALSGLRRTVMTDSNEAGVVHAFTVSPALPSAPTSGTSVTVFRGCDHTRTTCSGTFNNLPRFGGFADIPPKAT